MQSGPRLRTDSRGLQGDEVFRMRLNSSWLIIKDLWASSLCSLPDNAALVHGSICSYWDGLRGMRDANKDYG